MPAEERAVEPERAEVQRRAAHDLPGAAARPRGLALLARGPQLEPGAARAAVGVVGGGEAALLERQQPARLPERAPDGLIGVMAGTRRAHGDQRGRRAGVRPRPHRARERDPVPVPGPPRVTAPAQARHAPLPPPPPAGGAGGRRAPGGAPPGWPRGGGGAPGPPPPARPARPGAGGGAAGPPRRRRAAGGGGGGGPPPARGPPRARAGSGRPPHRR